MDPPLAEYLLRFIKVKPEEMWANRDSSAHSGMSVARLLAFKTLVVIDHRLQMLWMDAIDRFPAKAMLLFELFRALHSISNRERLYH